MLSQVLIEKFPVLMPMLLLMIMLGSINQTQAQTANLVPLGREFISSKVVAVEGNIVRLAGGFSADISQVEYKDTIGFPVDPQPIMVGQYLRASGKIVSQMGQPVMIKAEEVNISSGNQLSFTGTVQKVKAKKNKIMVLGREITVLPTTRILSIQGNAINLSDVKTGNNIDVIFDSTDNGFVAISILRLSPEDSRPLNHISGTLKVINGTRLELEGNFSFDVQPVSVGPEDELFNDPYFLGPGTRVGVSLSKEIATKTPKGVLKAEGSFGFSRGAITLDGNLQSFDAANRTITILNRTFTLPDRFFVLGPGGKSTLDKLVIGQGITLFAEETPDGLIIKVVLQPFV